MKAYTLGRNVQLFRFGDPFETESLCYSKEELTFQEEMELLECDVLRNNKNTVLTYLLEKEDRVVGFGESMGGINKRGRVIESYATDDPNHTPDKKALYGAHNYLFVVGNKTLGMYLDFPGKIRYDIGFTHPDKMMITIDSPDFDLYIFRHKDSQEAVRSFRKLQGKGYAPPKWAFGNQQSRWSYASADEVKQIADNMRKKWLPCDAIYLDIDYMENYKDFTIDDSRFPNFKKFVDEMKGKGFRLIPIIDAGVKIESGYGVYEEGVAKQYYCMDDKNNPFVAAVWPGWVHFPDFQQPEVRQWFGKQYKALTDCGIEGFWNDMNEPAIFYTEESMKTFIEKAKECEGKNIDLEDFLDLKDRFDKLSANPEAYQQMYQMSESKKIEHHKIHNLYGFNMTRSAAEGLEGIDPNKRYLLFSRSSYTGMGRYAGLWTGDNCSWWEHILMMIKMLPALNMGGFLYIGADIGGFGADASGNLLIRWTQASLLTPLFRNHAAMGTRNQEPYAFDHWTTETMRKMLELRYALIPYIYSEYMKAIFHQDLYFKILSFEYKDEQSLGVEDQLLVGESVMMAPIYQENARGRYVWVPEEMLLWKTVTNHQDEFQVVRKGHHYMNLELDETALFIRKNKMIVLAEPAQNVGDMDFSRLTVLGFVDGEATYSYYDDDGETMKYKKEQDKEMKIRVCQHQKDFSIHVEAKGSVAVTRIHFMLVNLDGECTEIQYDVSSGGVDEGSK